MATKEKSSKTVQAETPASFPVVAVEKTESAISQAGAKYQYPLEMAAKTARVNPRDERVVMEGALAELSFAPELAAESYYSIPRRKRLPSGDFDTIKIEGPSIGAAMSLARRWGNCINGSHIREELDDRVISEGVFIDAQTNTWTFRTVAAEKFYTDKNTKMKKPLAQDMLLNAILSSQSKAVRNAILATLPKWLTRKYFLEAKRIAGGGKPLGGGKADMTTAERLEWLFVHFPAFGVSADMAKAYIAANMKDLDPVDQVGELVGIYNALKDKQATVAEIFGTGKPAADKSAPTGEGGAVSGSDLFPGAPESL